VTIPLDFQLTRAQATPHAQRHELSREVHRIGYHIPTEVVSQVCSHYGIRLDSAGRLIGEQESEKLFMKISQKGEVVLNENIRDQVTINTEAKEIIRDLFPKIPDNDLFQIIKTAFQLGDNRVGTAEEIPLVRRAQLSVVAHIRHSYTNYDKLLRQVPYNEARHLVEKTTLRKLIEWRGDENDKTEESRRAVDDAVREVVVLSDEEESDSELEEGQVVEGKDMKLEPVRKPARPEVTTEHRPVSPGELSSGEDAPRGYRYVPQASRRTVPVQIAPGATTRQQQSRYALWDQVRHEYQSGVATQDLSRVLARVPLDDAPAARHMPASRDLVYEQIPPVRYVLEEPPPVSVIHGTSEFYCSKTRLETVLTTCRRASYESQVLRACSEAQMADSTKDYLHDLKQSCHRDGSALHQHPELSQSTDTVVVLLRRMLVDHNTIGEHPA